MIPELAVYLASEEAVTALRHARQALAAVTDCMTPILDHLHTLQVPDDDEAYRVCGSIVEHLASVGNHSHAADSSLLILLALSTAFGGQDTDQEVD